MTRFARAKGSKSSNERVPEVATSWAEIKQQLLLKKQEEKDLGRQNEIISQRNANYKAFLKEREEEESKNVKWADFPNIQSKEKPAKKPNLVKAESDDEPPEEASTKIQPKTQVANVSKGKKTKRKLTLPIINIAGDKIKAKKRKFKVENDDEPLEETTTKLQTKSEGLKKKKVKQKNKTLPINGANDKIKGEKEKLKNNVDVTHENGESAIDTMSELDRKKIEKKKQRRLKQLEKKKKAMAELKEKKKQEADQAANKNLSEIDLKKIERKKQKKERQLLKKKQFKETKAEEMSDTKASSEEKAVENNLDSNLDNSPSGAINADNSHSGDINANAQNSSVNASFKAKPKQKEFPNKNKKKSKNNTEFKRKKDKQEKWMINGKEIEVEYFDNFPIKKDDADRLKQLRKEMISKGLPRSEINIALKLERRKAEKAFAREKKKVCFNCRKSGHNLSECPELGKDQVAEGGTGICFKCGSTEHTHYECKVVRGENFKYASCFICNEQGHIAKQCPDNARGLYPKGGACKVCGDVTHLKKDCPKYQSQQEQLSLSVSASVLSGGNPDDLEGGATAGPAKINKKPNKVIRFK